MSTLQHRFSDGDPVMVAVAAVLLHAHDSAIASRRDPWQFALPLPALRELGALETHVRYLLAQGILEHRVEVTKPGSTERQFRPRAHASFERKSCFALSRHGVTWARKQKGQRHGSRNSVADLSKLNLPATPFYDSRRRVLQWGPFNLITLERRAWEVENFLSACQDRGWAPRIPHQPLPGGSHSKQRQRDLVRRLNKAQKPHMIRFRSDGDGVFWHPEP